MSPLTPCSCRTRGDPVGELLAFSGQSGCLFLTRSVLCPTCGFAFVSRAQTLAVLLGGTCPRSLGGHRLTGRVSKPPGAPGRPCTPLAELGQRGLSAPAQVCLPGCGIVPAAAGAAVLETRGPWGLRSPCCRGGTPVFLRDWRVSGAFPCSLNTRQTCGRGPGEEERAGRLCPSAARSTDGVTAVHGRVASGPFSSGRRTARAAS